MREFNLNRSHAALLLALPTMLLAVHQPSASAAGDELRAWGANGNGELGIGTNIGPQTCMLGEPCSSTPLPVPGLTQVSQVAAGDFHGLALTAGGTVKAWGFNGSGQLGRAAPLESTSPLEVPGLSNVVAIAAGHEFSLALLSNGTVMGWGENSFGQLGDGNTATTSTPTPVSALSGVSAIAAGGNHALALLANGTVVDWGAGTDGQLGNGQSVGSDVPVPVTSITTATGIAAGENHSLARLKTGKVMTWGENAMGQLGNSRTANSSEPVSVTGVSNAVAVAGGGYHSLALLSTGTVVAWGENSQGELGNNSTANATQPVAVNGLSGVTAIAAGAFHSLAVTSSGAAFSWGFGSDGQLGTGNTETSLVPVVIPGLGAVAGIAGGHSVTYAFEPAAPVVESISPAGGPPAGGTAVTISGANLGEAKQVTFGATAAKSFTVLSPTSITAVSPAGTGTVDVTVTTNTGTTPANPIDRFTYITTPPPSVGAVTPAQGPGGGGTEVKITGTNLGEASKVSFGSAAAPAFTIQSSGSITATSPAGSGTVDVRVSTPAGVSEAVAGDHFTYEAGGAVPALTKISPDKGAAAGGTTITVKGTNLSGVTSVRFGATPASSFKVISSTKLQALAPPGPTGPAEIRLTNAAGTSEASAKGIFHYGPPSVTAVSPSRGPRSGGTPLIVTGTGFAIGTGTIFAFGKFAAVGVNCDSSTQCTMTTAAATKAATVDVRATSGGLTSARSAPSDTFTYE